MTSSIGTNPGLAVNNDSSVLLSLSQIMEQVAQKAAHHAAHQAEERFGLRLDRFTQDIKNEQMKLTEEIKDGQEALKKEIKDSQKALTKEIKDNLNRLEQNIMFLYVTSPSRFSY